MLPCPESFRDQSLLQKIGSTAPYPPVLTDDENREPVSTTVGVQHDIQGFQRPHNVNSNQSGLFISFITICHQNIEAQNIRKEVLNS